ncbi:hypothetical protein TspCOW1_01820 [Thiohalobacter sp. COW1]|uniref:hypothetical protein n=1 Tax=Thiohalobacter sp. COW1 TaxID=2795687 RepID=UPI0019165DD0|nr:hypothetical protein [Thiohalobacter sp. COW1]BCO30079.1 hypothetical protein TspCOW1_01820 [Thiohalobacter sp. COW1]
MRALPPHRSHDLIGLFEASAQPIVGSDGQRLCGIPAWELDRRYPDFSKSPLDDWLTTAGYAGVIEADFDDEPVQVEIEEDDDPAWVRFREPNTLRWQRIPFTDTEVRQIAEQRFLNAVADLLDIPLAQRDGIASPAIPGVLWALGTARLGDGLHRQVWLVRKLDRYLPEVATWLSSRSSSGLLLSTGQWHSDLIRLPEGIVLCPLCDAVVSHLEETRLDTDWLYRRMLGVSENMDDSNFPIEFDPYRKRLVIRGKAPWVLKGPKHVKAVEYMFKQARKGRWELPAKEILAAVRDNGQVGGSVRMSSLFGANIEWEDYITRVRKGIYAFKLD